MAGHGQLTDAQMRAWRLFLRAHALVTRRLEADLATEQKLPLAFYDVLVQLVESPERKRRMSELAERVLLSRSGLTRLVDRMERDGLVTREPSEDDGRGLYAVLTAAGFDRLRAATPTHLRGVHDYAVGGLSDAQADELAGLLALVVDSSPAPA